MHIELWTDGSGKGIDPLVSDEPGGWAYVLLAVGNDGEVMRKVERWGGALHTSNNRMELRAVIEGVAQFRRPTTATVFCDSEYVVKAFTEGWVTKWEAKRWHKVKNLDLWLRLTRIASAHNLTWTHVRGHAKGQHPHNEACDKYAGAARLAVKDALHLGDAASIGAHLGIDVQDCRDLMRQGPTCLDQLASVPA